MTAEQFGKKMVELLPRLVRGIASRESNYLSKGKITLPQLWALEYLSREGDRPVNELARFLRISRPAATGLTDRLISQGLIRRQGDSRDRRVVQIGATPKGKRIVAHIWTQKSRMFAEFFEPISEPERAQYLAILQKVVKNLDEPIKKRGAR